MHLPSYATAELITLALNEDIGRGDITTRATIAAASRGTAVIKAKEPLILCGVELIGYIYGLIDPAVKIVSARKDGESLKKGDIVATVTGSCRALLTGERTVLNFLQRLSGVATLTQRYVAALDKRSKTKIVDTRKTTPGWRTLEKYAVRVGGGSNHRFALDDGVLIKDNHIVAAGSIAAAVKKARAAAHHLVRVEVETATLAEVKEALAAKADIIMLDNMDEKMIQKAIALINGRAVTELSGGVTIEKIPSLSRLGADLISVGALTHSAPAVDINLTLTAEK
ncbi:MAG TPA: carboxylating nicotinate-nucleotide diphosphorylase [bacterium]|nr:carboxylating nicotinate-nucleotide diphosphorylase [bacterium]